MPGFDLAGRSSTARWSSSAGDLRRPGYEQTATVDDRHRPVTFGPQSNVVLVDAGAGRHRPEDVRGRGAEAAEPRRHRDDDARERRQPGPDLDAPDETGTAASGLRAVRGRRGPGCCGGDLRADAAKADATQAAAEAAAAVDATTKVTLRGRSRGPAAADATTKANAAGRR